MKWGDKTRRVTAHMPMPVFEALDEKATELNMSISELLSRVAASYLKIKVAGPQ